MNIMELIGIGIKIEITMPEHNLKHDDIIRALRLYATNESVRADGRNSRLLVGGGRIAEYNSIAAAENAARDVEMLLKSMNR